jgi:diguanylate cyclase (GGDEF)-like protein
VHEGKTIRKFVEPAVEEKPAVRNSPHTVDLDSSDALVKAIGRRIAEWRRGGVKLSLVTARIDNLAALDAQGIRGRDRAMLHAGEYLKQELREMDQMALVAGEIFGMLLPTAALPDASRIAERMRSGVEQGALLEQLGGEVTISCGVAEVMADDDGETLVLRARRALEAARRRGGNAVYVNDGVYSKPAQDVLDLGRAKVAPSA